VYHWYKRNCRAYGGAFSGWAVGGGANGAALPCGSHYPNNANSYMMYGPFSLADATAAEMRYHLWMNSGTDQLMTMASVNGTDFFGKSIWGNSEGWVERIFDLGDIHTLGNLAGRPQVWVVIVFASDESGSLREGAYVDDIALRKYVPGVAVVEQRPLQQAPGVSVPGLMQAPAQGVIQR
jgi:hypothetical protein